MDRRRAAAALLALAACITCSAAAPTAGNHTALELHDGPVEGCYYNFQHYGEGDRIMTNEPCLNCTCHNRMLMCYLRVCPFTKAIGQDCTVEKRADQCCPIVTCPDVPVDLLTSTSTSSPAEYGATGLGKLDKYGCSIHGKYFPEGAKVPPTPNKPCEHCYCIRNMTTCVMQECTLHVDGCTPIYHKDVCCPVRYSCDHPEDEIPLLDDMTTTVRPTPGFLLTTTTTSPITQVSQDCVHDDQIFPDGALIKTEKACEHCYCMKGDIVCVVQECGTPMENEGKNCTSLPPRHGQCCPDTYICEGDELVTDSTTEFFELTSSPPRRVGIEGSGYRKETDELYTEMSPVTTEMEGSGEGFATGSQTDTGEYVTPEKEVIDETVLTTTERTLHLSQSTEPDKGQNTIPDSVIDKETAKEPLQEEVTLSGISESVTTASEEYTTARYLTSQKDELSTTESVIKINDESNSDETSTPKEDERRTTTESTDLMDKTTPLNEIILHTNPIIIEQDQKATTSPSTEYTTKVKEISEQEGLSTEILVESSVTEKNKFTDVFQTSFDTEISIEPTTTKPVTNLFVAESTSVNPNINEIDDSTSPALAPSRIPGEGDCLLNGITYTNNTSVPSTNNCHTGCKCMSSIIKCDPIICSPPPEYMENMNDCQPIYDTPNSCCPTYVCNVKETIPPESHSHMSGTESPKPIAPSECSGNGCLDNEDKKMPMEPTSCSSGDCLGETPTVQQECKSNHCKDQLETTPSIPSHGIGMPCEGENCKTELLEKESESTKTPAFQQKCESDDCKDQVQVTPSESSPDCSDGECEISPETSCKGESCKIHPPTETVHDKDLEPSSHDVPPKICNGEIGCDENNIIGPEECVGESCRRKEFTEVGAKEPSICSGADCKQHDEPTGQSTEQVSEMVTEGSTDKDVNQENLDTIQSHITTAKITLLESDLDLTKQPIYMESTEKLSTSFEQIITEPPKKYDTEKETVHTDSPLIHTGTDINTESVTEAVQTESPKLYVTETKEPQETVSHTDERLTTEINLPYTTPSEYLETETKEFLPGEDEYLSTEKAHIYTGPQDLGTVIDEEHTKLPEVSASELENPTTKAPESVILEHDRRSTESPETITKKEEFVTKPQGTFESETKAPESVILEHDGRSTESPETITKKEEFVTKPQGTFETEKETIYFEATETSIPVTEVGTQSGTSEAATEKEIKETKSPVLLTTDREQLHTEVTETIIDREDIRTHAPEIFATDKEVAVDKEIIQTGTEETSFTGSPEIIDVEKETVQYVSPDVAIPTKEPTEVQESMFTKVMQTLDPDATVTKTEEVLSEITETATEKEGIKLSTPDLHDMKVESTTPLESSEEEQTIISFNPITDEAESDITNPQATTNKPEITEEKEYGESYKPKPTKPEDILTEAITEIVTELIASDVTEKTHVGVTESISQPTSSEIIEETATKETHKVTSEEQEMYTKSPQEIIFNASTEIEASTDKDLLYTSKPDVHETKHDDVSQAIDQSDTESHVTATNSPNVFTLHYSETSTVHDAIITDKYKESPDTYKESTFMPMHEITREQEKYTEAPERYSTESQAQDESTKLPDHYTTLAEEILIPQKSTDKPHETLSSDLEKDDDDTTDKVHETTLRDIEKIITTESSQFITVTPLSSIEPQNQPSTDQKLDSESPHLVTKTEDSDKEPESSTDIFEHVTDISKTHTKHPEFIEEVEKDLTTKITEHDIATESYKETTSENLLSQTTYKEELHTEPQQTVSQDTSYTIAVSEPYVETSTKTIIEKEKEKQDQETTTITSQTTQSKDEGEFESTLSFIKTPKPEFVTEKDAVEYTTKDEIKETPYDTEKHDSNPFIPDEKPSYSTEESSLMGAHYPEHTDMGSLTTQKSLPNVENANNNVLDSNEISTKGPESITMLEQNTLDIKDTVTTESHVSYTSSEDKLSTMVSDTKEIQKEQESYTADYLTTSTSLQPEDYKKVTEPPMSQVTHTDHASSPQTILTTKGDIAEQASETTVEPKLEEEKTQTTMSEVQKQSTETPDYHITQQQIEPASNLGVDHEEKITTPIIGDEFSMDQKTTFIPQQQTDFSKDVPTVETVSDLYNQNTEVTPDTKEVVVDTQPQTTTTGSLPMEKEPDITHEQETLSTVSVTEMVSKLPHETQTVLEDITVTPSVLRDDEHVKEIMATAGIFTEQHGLATQYPEINVHDMYSTTPEKVSFESEGSTGTEATKVSVEKESESATSVYVPPVTEPTEKPMPVATEISEPDITEKDHQPTEIEEQLEEKTTTQIYLDEVTEKDILYTQSKPLYTTEVQNVATQQKEITTEALDRTTIVPDQAITQSLFTGIPESDDHYGITDSVDKDKKDEHIPSQSTTQISEIITEEMVSEKEQPTLTETVKETESQPEKHSTQPTIEKELFTTEATTDSSKESDKEMPDVHNISTEFTPTTLTSSYTKTQPAQTQNEFDKSEEPKQTTEPGHEISETTPFLVELKEHTHEVIDDSSRTPIEEILTTSLYEPQQTERGDQSLDVTDKYEKEYQTSVPITVVEDVQEDKEKPVTHSPEQAEEKVSTTTPAVKDFTDHISDTDIVSATSPSYLETDLQEKEKHYTTTVQDVVLTTSAAPQTISEKEFYTTITTDVKNSTYPETSSISEKDINLVTEEPLKSEISFGTTLTDEDLLRETLKSTTSNIKEESTTHSPLPDKSTLPEEKPIKPTPSPPTQELTKPAFDDEINEGLPSPDFPPSGTGGYGQETDYIEEDQAFGPGTCRYGGKVYVSAQQIPRDDPCDFCFCFRSDIICLQQSCPPPIHGCHEEPIQGFCCPRYECPVSMATTLNVTTTTTTTTTTLPPHFLPHAYKGAAQRRGCQIKGHTYKVGEVVRASSGPCLHCTCGGDGQMKCDPKACTPEPMLRQMIAAAVSAKRRR